MTGKAVTSLTGKETGCPVCDREISVKKKFDCNRILLPALILALMLALLSLGGCSFVEKLTGDKEEEQEQNVEETVETDPLNGLPENVVFTVDSVQITKGEWNLYALPRAGEITGLYGDNIWSYQVDNEGNSFDEAFKEDVLDEIAYTKIVASRADEIGVSLNEDDNVEISIETADFMSRLSKEQCEEYGITEEIVRTVYRDNILARKVYENITLNIDMNTDEKEVRHMVLQYVMVPKSYEDNSGENALYDENELEVFRTRFKNLKAFMDNNPGITLKEAAYEDMNATEIIADYSGLCEMLPEDLAGIAFWLRNGEVSDVYETADAFFIFNCVKMTDDETTDAARIRVLEQREKDCFNSRYEAWRSAAVITKNDAVWYRLKVR